MTPSGRVWGDREIHRPTLADLAEGVVYQQLRPGILQKALNEMAAHSGQRAPRVLTPEQFVQILDRAERNADEE